MRLALSIALVFALATALPAEASKPKPSKLPTQLWQKYPLGTKRLAPVAGTKTRQFLRASKLAPRPATPRRVAVGRERGGGGGPAVWIVIAVLLAVLIPAVVVAGAWRDIRRG